jgi:peptidoglycan hydrolase-like protein with peptidoglycan-binding domain
LKAEADAKAKAEADAKAKAEADVAADRKSAEATETALRLSTTDRQRLQVALTSLGFDTRGSDGVFGPRSREMIAGWQKAQNQPSTGFLTGPQQQALLRAAAVAIGLYDEEQRKAADQKKKADEEAKKADEEKRKTEGTQKKVTLVNKGGSGTCDQTGTYVLRFYPNMVDIMFKSGWRTLAVDAEGTFSGNFQNEGAGGKVIKLSVTGSVKNGFISVVNLGGQGCTWVGKF